MMTSTNQLVTAVDCDDIIVESALAILSHYHKTYGVEIPPSEAYSNDPQVWGVEDFDERVERITGYLKTDEYQRLPPIKDAVIALRELKHQHELHLVTGRLDFLKSPTLAWLAEHFPDVFSSTEFTNFIVPTGHNHVSRTKAEVCEMMRADVLIEDHPHHALQVAKTGVHVLLFDYPWNRSIDSQTPNVTRVKDWKEIVHFLNIHAADT